MKSPRPLTLAIALAGLFAGSVQAQNLVDVFNMARGYDASYQSARAQYESDLYRAAQAKAGLLPTVGLSAGANWTTFDNTTGPVNTNRDFSSTNGSVSASQPLYRPAAYATYEQSEKQVVAAKARLTAAEQDLILRVTVAYFEVLSAQDNLGLVQAQKKAVAEQLAVAKRNFEVGVSTITDTRESEARYDQIVAAEIGSENDLQVKRLALDQLVGKSGIQPKPLAIPFTPPPLNPPTVDAWVAISATSHPAVIQNQVQIQLAKLETQKAEAGHKPTVDLVASYGASRFPGGSTTTGYSTNTSTGNIGVSLNWPLFNGFAVQNRIKETLSLEDKAQSDLLATERTVAQSTRSAFYGLKSGMSQVKALETAVASTQSAVDSNLLGYQVGVRINLDVLNSQSQLFLTKRDLDQTRYSVLTGGLKLRLAAGTLTAEDLEAVNAFLAK